MTVKEKGFSLLEVTGIVLLVAIILAIALPTVGTAIRAYNLKSAASHIAARLSAVRALAIAKNRNVTFSFNNSTKKYGFDFNGDGTPDTVDPDDPSASYNSDTLPGSMSATFPGNVPIMVTFSSRGELLIGVSDKSIVLTSGTKNLTVTVNMRGRIYVH